MPGSRPNWTVAVHLAGGKSLTEQMIRALQEMRDEANSREGRFRIVAQFEPQGKLPRAFVFDLDDAPSPFALPFTPVPRRALMRPALASYEYVLDTSQTNPEQLSSTQLLARFVETGKSASAGGPFLLVISGHGNGAVGPFLAHRDPGAELSLMDLPAVFDSAGISPQDKIDILGLDCCAMSMIEVGFELSPYARFLVAPVRHLAETLTRRIEDPGVWQPVVLAHWEAQSYKDEEYVDLADFCDRLCRYLPDWEVQSCCADVITAVAEVVKDSYVTGATYQYSTGLSVYFPWSNDAAKGRGKEIQTTSDLEGYKMLKFNRETKWGDFLDAYLDATQRKPGLAKHAVERIDALPARRSPPFGKGGEKIGASIKNHPTSVPPREDQPVRRFPPLGKGGDKVTASIKNHPLAKVGSGTLPKN